MYPHPFSAAYWRAAAREVKDLRKLTFAALMIAMCIVLSHVPSIPLFGGAKVTWGFLARSVCALVCGPVLGLIFGFAEDILSFFLTGGGGYPFFPGYTLSTMLGLFFYALGFYRQRLTIFRIAVTKLAVNLVCNVALGTLWNSILFGKAYLFYFWGSLGKNLTLWPFEVAVMVLVYRLVTPVLEKQGLMAPQGKK